MNFKLNIWRQKNANTQGSFQHYKIDNIQADDSFLEMLDQLNEKLIIQGDDAICFDYDCREGICGACSLVINGYPHGEKNATTTCQLYMRDYQHQTELWIEPFRSKAFPILKDLSVQRNSFDKIIQAGGWTSVHAGSAPEANTLLIKKIDADEAFNSAICIGCGACVAVCPNSSASLFVAAKLSHLALLPQGQIESITRKNTMIKQMEIEGFGSCSNHRYCTAICPKKITLSNITKMNKI